jgi:hypothetical protein
VILNWVGWEEGGQFGCHLRLERIGSFFSSFSLMAVRKAALRLMGEVEVDVNESAKWNRQ